MMFYLAAYSMVTGIESIEVREFFEEEAKSEMAHVKEFSNLIVGLGGVPEMSSNSFVFADTSSRAMLNYALLMEEEVIENYCKRMADAEALGGTDGRWIVIFLEEQVMHSREDVDKIRQLLK